MPADKSTDRLTPAEEVFKTSLLGLYDLESDFVSVICGLFRKAAEPLVEASGTPKRARAASKPKKVRKKSAYNVFVREMMKDQEIKDLDHKEKMGAIAKKWKEVDEAQRKEYSDMANEENATTPTEEFE